MAKKSLILSNDDGRVFIPTTSSISIDDATENISVSALTASVLKINGLADDSHGLLQINSSGTASVFNNNTVDNSTLIWNGSSWDNNNIVIGSRFTGSTGGDLSGSIEGDIKVVSVANVNAGALPTNHGGTNTNLTANSSHILQISKAANTVTYSAITGVANLYPTVISNQIVLKQPNFYPDVKFYSTPGTYTWTRPAGITFIRIILQGGGGGGGGAYYSTSGPSGEGCGGGSGGFTDLILNSPSLTTATISVAAGGAGGVGSTSSGIGQNPGSAGGISTFIYTIGNVTTTIVANGGGGGAAGVSGNNNSTSGGAAAAAASKPVNFNNSYLNCSGIFRPGGKGAGAGQAASSVYGIAGPGGAGGWNNAPTVVPLISSTCFGYYLTSDGVDLSNVYNGSAINFFTSFNNGNNPADGLKIRPQAPFGCGGSGANRLPATFPLTKGSPGGNGYAIIISW